MDEKEKMNLINNLIESFVDVTRAYEMTTEEEIRTFIQGEIDYAYKCNFGVTPEQRKLLADAISSAVIRQRFGKNATPKPTMKIYVARDRAIFEDEAQENFIMRHPDKETEYGQLHLFYDKPEFNKERGVWECAREAAPMKNYMFPNIKCEKCAVFEGSFELPEYRFSL